MFQGGPFFVKSGTGTSILKKQVASDPISEVSAKVICLLPLPFHLENNVCFMVICSHGYCIQLIQRKFLQDSPSLPPTPTSYRTPRKRKLQLATVNKASEQGYLE